MGIYIKCRITRKEQRSYLGYDGKPLAGSNPASDINE